MQTVTILGAGPAGLLLAHYLLARQYRVKIYERRPDPLASTPDSFSLRTFPMTLQQRGLKAIGEIPGLEATITAKGTFSYGTLLHRRRGQPRYISRKLPLLMINRRQIVQILLAQLLERYDSDRVNVRFDCVCSNLDLENQKLTFLPSQEQEGSEFTVHYDRLVAADGARSQIRSALEEQAGLQCEQTVIPDVYKSVAMPRVNKALDIELAPDCIHGWRLGLGSRLLLVPQPGDSLQGTLIFQPGQDPLENLSTGEAVLSFFQQKCPPVGQLMSPETAEDLLKRPSSKILSVQCDRMHAGDRIAMIGDAVHAVSPSIGQGCNAALQDAKAFADCLEEYKDDWEQALPAFTARRLPEAHALRSLSDYSFPRSKPMILEFVIRALFGKKLGRWLPTPASPMPLTLVMDTELSYTEVLQRCQGWVNRVRRSMPSG